MKNLFMSLLLAWVCAAAHAKSNNEELLGYWSGYASFEQERTRVALTFTRESGKLGASITLQDIGVSGWPAIDIKQRGKSVTVVLPSDSGPQELILELRDGGLYGAWHEKNFSEPAALHLTRQGLPVKREKRLRLQGEAGTLGASLILPQGEGPFPAVVFLHGSGPQPRDASRFAAESFARQGIASLIYDKRGVGESEGALEKANFDDLAGDAIVAANYLSSLDEIAKVGFWGHSQGGWLAPLAASRWEASTFVITSAGALVSPAREGEWGFVHAVKSFTGESAIEANVRNTVAAWHDGLRSGNWESFDGAVQRYKSADWFKASGLQTLVRRPDPSFAMSYKAYMDYDPLAVMNKLGAPMLAIYALEDESIDSEESLALLSQFAESGKPIRIKTYQGYSHSMRKLASGNKRLRFPNHPEDYFSVQAEFILQAVK